MDGRTVFDLQNVQPGELNGPVSGELNGPVSG
jgi:hypothetical protein